MSVKITGIQIVGRINGRSLGVSPTLESASPISATSAGGTTVTITGSAFSGATAVKFNGVSAASFTVISDTSLTAVTPSGTVGDVTISITTPQGTGSASGLFAYTYAAPTVTSVSPTYGGSDAGATVTLTGTNFYDVTSIGITPGRNMEVTSFMVVSPTTITAVLPSLVSDTSFSFIVNAAGGSVTSAAIYTTIGLPTVSGISPVSGNTASPNTVTITGTKFVDVTAVELGGLPVTEFTVLSATSISAVIPAASVEGRQRVVITTTYGTSTDQVYYAYSDPVAADPYWDNVRLLVQEDETVDSTTVVDLKAFNQSFVTGSVHNSDLSTPFGLTSLKFNGADDNIYYPDSTAWDLNSSEFTIEMWINPTSLSGNETLLFGQVDLSTAYAPLRLSMTSSAITARTPQSWSNAAVNSQAYTVDTWYHVAVVRSGDLIKVYVNGVAGATSTNLSAIPAIASSSAALRIGGVPGSPQGLIDFVGYIKGVRYTIGTARYTSNFTPVAEPWPSNMVSELSMIAPVPASGDVNVESGEFIVSLRNAKESVVVTPGDTASGTFTPTSITLSPANAISAFTVTPDVIGSHTISVTNDAGLTNPSSIEYTSLQASPVLNSVTPSEGDTGTNSVTLSGANFTGATSVTFGGTAAVSFTVVNDTTITATAPAHAVGAVSVIVTTSVGSNAANTLYSYRGVPVVSSLDPAAGTSDGGTSVVITGSDFTGATSVTFGGVEATSFTVDNSTTITAVTPAGIMGSASVNVTTAYGTNAANTLFTYGSAPDPYWSNVVLLVQNDAADGSTVIIDSKSAKTPTIVGTIVQSTAVTPPYGTSSLRSASASGDPDYFSFADSEDWNFGTGNFTLETWFRVNSFTGAGENLLIGQVDSAGYAPLRLTVTSTTVRARFQPLSWGTGTYKTVTITPGTWYHVAIVRNGTSIQTYVNGSSGVALNAGTGTVANVTDPLQIAGGRTNSNNVQSFNGYVKGVRITKGVARYTANFTPSTSAYPEY